MKLSVKPELLKILTLCAGGLGLVLHTVLYATGVDGKGLLITGHWASVALWILTGVTIAALFVLTRFIRSSEDYHAAHPASFIAGTGAFAAAAAAAFTVMSELAVSELLPLVIGFTAAISLVIIGICRLSGKKPIFLCHTVVCVFFAMRMVGQYQHWNSDPQVQDLVFNLGAYVALMLHAYQQAAFDAEMGNHRALWCTGLIGVYLCCVSLRGSMDTRLILGAGIWVLTNLTCLNVRPRRQRPVLNLDTEPQEEV